ncbi:hypothetical protein PVAP13_9KG246200 [Panicum virgatum]|uniref:Non-haem dioxygenase N-terminal domain-containing protein n=1 Tax=Panicum virgatum TaxID=38727 RepID=A0A8T0P5F7_PANVG|nr:hypothetical protein PVAP13_9KG246200 [Panicum virgatum]
MHDMESLPVPSVQAMVAATGGAHVPPRYLRPEVAADAVASEGEAAIPIIDFERLLLEEEAAAAAAASCRVESARLHAACQEWGFFQLINHGVPDDVIQGMKANIEAFFGLPAETKQQFAQERGQLEGYGQLFVVSEDQKLDWADILYLNTQPPEHRNTRFWPDKPDTLSSPPPFAHHNAAVLSSPLPAAQCWACAPPAWQTGGEPGVGGAVAAAGGGWGRRRSGDGRQREPAVDRMGEK